MTCKINNVDLPKVVAQGLGKAIEIWQEDVHVSGRDGLGRCDAATPSTKTSLRL